MGQRQNAGVLRNASDFRDFCKKRAEPDLRAQLIMKELNMFVQCYLLLNKESYACVGSFETGFFETTMCGMKTDVTEEANVGRTSEKFDREY